MSEEPDESEPAEKEQTETEQRDTEPTDAERIPEEERTPLSSLRDRLEARAAEGESDIDEGAPLSDLAEEARASSEAERSELFEEVDVGDVDPEAVWEAVVEEGEPPEEMFGEPEGASPAEPTESPDEHVIDKRQYCQRCEFFGAPPGVAAPTRGPRSSN